MKTYREEKGSELHNRYILVFKNSATKIKQDEREMQLTYDDNFDTSIIVAKMQVTNMDDDGTLYGKFRVENVQTQEVEWYDNLSSMNKNCIILGKTLSELNEQNLLIWYPIVNFHTYCYMAQNEQYFDIEYTHNGITYIMNTEGSLEPIQIAACDQDVTEEQFEKSYAAYNTVYEMFEKYTFLDGTRLWDEKEKYINVAKKYFLNLP